MQHAETKRNEWRKRSGIFKRFSTISEQTRYLKIDHFLELIYKKTHSNGHMQYDVNLKPAYLKATESKFGCLALIIGLQVKETLEYHVCWY